MNAAELKPSQEVLADELEAIGGPAARVYAEGDLSPDAADAVRYAVAGAVSEVEE